MDCPHHPTCPGCPLADLDRERQLAVKRDRLADAMARYPHLDLPEVPEVRPALRQEGYRHRLKLPVHVGKRVAIGLYERGGERVLDTPACPVLVPALRDALDVLREILVGHHEVHSVDLRISDATGQLQLVLAAADGKLKDGASVRRALRERLPALASVAVSTADPARRRVMGRRPTLIEGDPEIEEAIGTTRYRLHPGAFFQVDPANAAQLHAIVEAYVGDAHRVLDLYAGVGAYALALAEGREILAVEEVAPAASAAKAMAPPQVTVLQKRVEDVRLDRPVDVAILNPARRGSDPGVLASVAKVAERVVYVSCGPETLARDLDILAYHGLRVADWTAIDLFPQTPEVETIVHLVRGRVARTWHVPGGRAGSPWADKPSGALGRPSEILALVIGDPGPSGHIRGGRFRREAIVATHALVRIQLDAPLHVPLVALAHRGHPTAGHDPRTAKFFAAKAGLLRPFVHVTRAGEARSALHGDLAQALVALGMHPKAVSEVVHGRRR